MSLSSEQSMDLTDTDSSIQHIQQSLESIYATLGTLIALQKKVEKKVLSIKPVYTFFTLPRNASQGGPGSYSDRLEEALAHPATTLSVGGASINGIDCYTYFQRDIIQSPFAQSKK